MSAYTNATAVAQYLAVTLSVAQTAQVTGVLAPAATAAIDSYTGRSWQATTVTDERVRVYGDRAWLPQVPVSALSRLTWRTWLPGATATTGVSGTDYELRDGATGLVVFQGDAPGDEVRASYTAGGTPPAPVALAAAMLVAEWLRPTLAGLATGGTGPLIRKREGDVERAYAAPSVASSSAAAPLPDAVAALLAPYRVGVVA